MTVRTRAISLLEYNGVFTAAEDDDGIIDAMQQYPEGMWEHSYHLGIFSGASRIAISLQRFEMRSQRIVGVPENPRDRG